MANTKDDYEEQGRGGLESTTKDKEELCKGANVAVVGKADNYVNRMSSIRIQLHCSVALALHSMVQQNNLQQSLARPCYAYQTLWLMNPLRVRYRRTCYGSLLHEVIALAL